MKKIVINNDVEQFFEGFVNEELFAKIGMGLLIAGIAAVVLGLLNYIFTSLAYVRISKRRGIKAGWLARTSKGTIYRYNSEEASDNELE